ncbi:hypothetical protein A7U60_g3268 [Sanghuangporus baumii]|uniref:Uncharacterized protein n=1 Tax=Sanghuangporus baumii TaxID=108892 RepID=A0A9Q5I0S4_SANBA|nr:hypothetical protein A7U60_g3268 [Sanghuangporus baumii]
MGRELDNCDHADSPVDHTTDVSSLSKKKRKWKEKEALEVSQAIPAIADADQVASERRKKKKRKKHTGQIEMQESAVLPEQQTAQEESTLSVPESSKKEKKKKKKRRGDKEEEQRVNSISDVQIDPSLAALDGTADADTNAFLSAIVTAANGSTVQGHPQANDFAQQSSFVNPSFQNLPPGLGGPAVSFSGEDLAHALQTLDVAKLADALQALGEAGSSAFPFLGQSVASQQAQAMEAPQIAVPISSGSTGARSQPPVPCTATVSRSTRKLEKQASSRRSAQAPSPNLSGRDDHAYLLANKWLSATKLNELSASIGLQYRKGKFSATEEALLRNAIENYRVGHNLSDEQLNEVIFAKGLKDKDNAFWFEITAHVPDRPVVAVYHHVRRSFHPLKQQGKWTVAEDNVLRQAVADLGQSWEKVSQRVGRMAGDCRDRWRNHINNRDGRIFGAWSKEEEEKLTQIVTEMTIAQGKDPDLDVFWTQVAARMGSRGRQQCRIKWTDGLSKTVKNSGQKPRWSQQDAYILVHKIASLNVNDDSEIDWKLLNDETWNLWSAHTLQRRWLTLKRSIRGHEEMTHQEIMDILRVKKAQPPPMPPPVKRRVTSAAIVPAEAQAADVAIEDTLPNSSGFDGMHGTPFPVGGHPQSQSTPIAQSGSSSGALAGDFETSNDLHSDHASSSASDSSDSD